MRRRFASKFRLNRKFPNFLNKQVSKNCNFHVHFSWYSKSADLLSLLGCYNYNQFSTFVNLFRITSIVIIRDHTWSSRLDISPKRCAHLVSIAFTLKSKNTFQCYIRVPVQVCTHLDVVNIQTKGKRYISPPFSRCVHSAHEYSTEMCSHF